MLLLQTGSGRRQKRAMQTQRLLTPATPKLLAPAVSRRRRGRGLAGCLCSSSYYFVGEAQKRGMGRIAVVYGVYSGGVVGLIGG
jgi:hypothetical protein